MGANKRADRELQECCSVQQLETVMAQRGIERGKMKERGGGEKKMRGRRSIQQETLHVHEKLIFLMHVSHESL